MLNTSNLVFLVKAWDRVLKPPNANLLFLIFSAMEIKRDNGFRTEYPNEEFCHLGYMPCSPLKVNIRFVEIYRLHFQS